MSSRTPFPRFLLILALAALTVSLPGRVWAQDKAPATTPGSTLPASGAAAEPGDDVKKTPPVVKAPAAADNGKSLPPPKPLVVHSERDAEIGRIVGGLLEQSHYLQKPISNDMSQRWLSNYFLALDYNHLFFLQSDIDEFTAKYGNKLGDLMMHGDSENDAVAPAFEIFERYLTRVSDRVTLAQKLVKEKFDFSGNETFTLPTNKSAWLKDQPTSDALWQGQVKADLLNGLLDKKDPAVTAVRVSKRYKSLLRERQEMDDMDVIELYLSALTHAYDPHSDYFQPDEAQNFNIQAIDHAVTGIGAVLKSEDGYATIEEVIAGGPADLDKRIQAGDKILAVGQGTKEPVDAVNMKLNRVVDMIRGEKGTSVHLVVQPAGASDGVHKDIILKRDMVSIKDSLAKADIIVHKLPNGSIEKLGVINLHDFYNNTKTSHSASSDVAELITRLKKEQVAGIILDMRNNGGGLLDQAIELTALFVKHEPVVQVRRSDGYIDQLKTDDARPLYDGPLVVMVNRMSASATEIVAAALQDYGRAVIVGDQSTHGKGTVQTLIPLDQYAPLGFTIDPGKLKMTVQKFYRVAGGSTQQKGVVPDIILPSILDALELGETNLPYYMPYDVVPSAPFDYLNETATFLPDLSSASKARVNSSTDFGYVKDEIDYWKKRVKDTTVSLNLGVRQKELADRKAVLAARKKDQAARLGTRDKELELTLDMVDQNLPAAVAKEKKPKPNLDDSDSTSPADGDDAVTTGPVDDPQLDETVAIMCDYTRMLQDTGSKLVQATPSTAK